MTSVSRTVFYERLRQQAAEYRLESQARVRAFRESIAMRFGIALKDGEDIVLAIEREVVAAAMNAAGDNQSEAAAMVGVTRYALRYRLGKKKGALADAPPTSSPPVDVQQRED